MRLRSQASDDLSYALLTQLEELGSANQRELAQRLGISLGKANYCVRAVIVRGWVKVNNFRRSDNKLAYAYMLTPSGAQAKIRLARAFLARKELEFEQLQQEIHSLRRQIQQAADRPVDG